MIVTHIVFKRLPVHICGQTVEHEDRRTRLDAQRTGYLTIDIARTDNMAHFLDGDPEFLLKNCVIVSAGTRSSFRISACFSKASGR